MQVISKTMPEQGQPGTIHENVVEQHHDAPTRTICIAGTIRLLFNLHPVDQSEYAKHVFQWSIDNLIKPDTDQVVLLTVRPFVTSPMYSFLLTRCSYQRRKHRLVLGNRCSKQASITRLDPIVSLLLTWISYAKGLTDKEIKVRGVALRGDARE
jgi:hypothetical protein